MKDQLFQASTAEGQSNEDKLIQSILTTVCFNAHVNVDVIQLLRLLIKQKTEGKKAKDVEYRLRNKILNSFTSALKFTHTKDTAGLL
mmetsp:Transcript_38990/g.59292  ORF Transcript_38990/g.59292 Transcript_38990/m.59292 type:complete len:87 (+) Transcript_38990:1626-1886(+)